MTKQAEIGLIGLGVMGRNLVLNMDDHGFTVAVYNRTISKVDDFLHGDAWGTNVIGTYSVNELAASLKRPRKVMIMVKAGVAAQKTVDSLIPCLDKGDVVINGGNENYKDSAAMAKLLESKGLLYVGCGVSGGEEGARLGPSLMPGGSAGAWPFIREIFQAIAAKVEDGSPCCDWIGEGGAGHFVKMVHNGIEYGDMQLISEAYDLMKSALGMSPGEIGDVFRRWNDGKLSSYLIEITAKILRFIDEDGQPLVDRILDVSGQKGTGRWTTAAALESGVPLTLIGEAVFARFLSSLKDDRRIAHKELSGPAVTFDGDREEFIEKIRLALYASKIISYTQGYMLLHAVSKQFDWKLNFGGIAQVWREGCIIRAAFLVKIKDAFDKDPALKNLLLDSYFKGQVISAQTGWRRAVSEGIRIGVPLPAMSSALSFYDGYRRERLPAGLVQAQRDWFGAHRYERIDRPRGRFFHTDWTQKGEN